MRHIREMLAFLFWNVGVNKMANKVAGITEEEYQNCQDYINKKWEEKS